MALDSRYQRILNMDSHPPKLVLGQSDTRIEFPAELSVRAIPYRSAEKVMETADGFKDSLLRKRQNDIRGVEVCSNGKSHDSLGGLFCPVLEDFSRVVMLPKPILEAEHFKITQFFHFTVRLMGSTLKRERTSTRMQPETFESGQKMQRHDMSGIQENATLG
jgi:hypothetical protein